jgi:DnaJ-class molecular chaperone
MALNRTERNHMLLSIAVAKHARDFKDVDNRTCVVCSVCDGAGLKPGAPITDLSCTNCKGRGYLIKIVNTKGEAYHIEQPSKKGCVIETRMLGGKIVCHKA